MTQSGEGMKRDSLNDVWVVIPAYNEGTVIREVAQSVLRVFPNVVVIDDGSRDQTAAEAATAGATVLKHAVNLGQGAALQTGFTYALKQGADYIVTFDADGQHQIEDALGMLDLMRARGVDVVLGSRFAGTALGISPGRRALLWLATVFTKLTTGLALTDAHNGLRVLSRKAASAIQMTQNGMAHASEILEQIAAHRLRYAEYGNTVVYTDYSRRKGQKALNAVGILLDLLAGRLSK